MALPEEGYPRFLRELLDSCPFAGKGVHQWLFKVARYLHAYHSPEEICAILAERVAGCGREIEPHEIPDAVANSAPFKWKPNNKTPSERRAEWLSNPTAQRVPVFNPELAIREASRVRIEVSAEWLRSRSPVSVRCSAGDFLEAIFGREEKVLVFEHYKSQGRLWPAEIPDFDRWSRIKRPDGAWFLCNPVDGLTHFNPRLCKDSRRSQESVTAFRFAVLECDHQPKEKWFPIWLKILVQLTLQIVSITDSAGKSAHALVRVGAQSKQAWDAFKCTTLRPLVEFGADDGALSAVRLTRLPGAYRGHARQELLYLNPATDGTPIFTP